MEGDVELKGKDTNNGSNQHIAGMINPDDETSSLVTNDTCEEGSTEATCAPKVTTPSNVEGKVHLLLKSYSVTLEVEVANENDIGGGEVDGNVEDLFQESVEEEYPGSSGCFVV